MRNRPTQITLLVFIAAIFAQRCYLKNAPLHSDICAYALIGHEMIHGRQLYTDLWERKPPLLYATFAAAEAITGYGPNEIVLINLVAPIIMLLLIYYAGRAGGGGNLAGLLAAGFWTLLCSDLDLAANQPDPEVFINIFLAASVVLLLNWPAHQWIRSSILLGTLFAAATLYKHNVVLICIALAGAHVVVPASVKWTRRLIESLISGGIILTIWLALFGYFAVNGRLHDMVEVLFHQNVAYSGNMLGNLGDSARLDRLFLPFMVWVLGPLSLVLLTIIFALFRRHRGIPKRGWILLAWSIGASPTIALTGHVYPHYYQLWIPIACIAGGWAAAALLRSDLRVPPLVSYGSVLMVFVVLVFRQGSEFLLTPEQWVHRQFPYFNLFEKTQLAQQLGQVLKPDEQFWELGEDNDLYFLSHHSPPTGLLYIDPLIYGDKTDLYWNRLMKDLNAKQPVLVILAEDWTKFFRADAPIFAWLQQNYQPCETIIGWPAYPVGSPPYQMWTHRGSDLKPRLEQMGNRLESPTLPERQPAVPFVSPV